MGEGDGKYLQIFELMKNDLRFVTADYLGIDPNQPFDPESFVLSKRFDILGTYEAYKKFHVEEDGIPKTEDLLWTIVSTYTDWKVELTSSIDLELSVREANTKRGSGQKETLPAGTHFVLLKTDGEAYAEAMLDDGQICEFELEQRFKEKFMFTRPDNTYNDIREKSLMQWLDEMEQHSDVAVRGGVKLTREYMQHLQEEIRRLEEENQLKAQYLKKMKEKNCK